MAGINELLIDNKKFKGDTFREGCSLDETQLDYPRLPVYNFNFDLASGGGVACGAITQFYGVPKGGKSLLSYLAAKGLSKTCGRCLKPKHICTCPEGVLNLKTFVCHTEGLAPDALFFSRLGYDASDENIVIYEADSGEKACLAIEQAAQADDVGLVIVDSLANIQPSSFYESEYGELNVGSQAKLLKKMSTRVARILGRELRRGHNVACIMINQVTSNIGAAKWEATEKTIGGWATRHNCRMIAQVTQLSTKEMDKDDGTKDVLRFSINLNGACSKDQMFTMLGRCEYQLVMRDWDGYDTGSIVDYNLILELAKKLGMLEKVREGYELHVSPKMTFRVLSEIEDVFRKHEYVDKATGEIICFADDLIRFQVLQEVKKRNIRKIMESRKIKVITSMPLDDSSSADQSESEEGEDAEV